MFHGMTHVVDAIERAFDDTYDHDTLARVAWSTIAEPGDRRVCSLIGELGAAPALDALVDDQLEALPGAPLAELRAEVLPRLSLPTIVGALAVTVEERIRLLTPSSISWPTQLNDLGKRAPLGLWVRGDHSQLRMASVAVTGGRTATAFGFRACSDLAWGLADRAYTVMAGGSYGIDSAAHRAALKAGGRTVAVMASPVTELFPIGNVALLEEIIGDGAVVSERPPCTTASRWRFSRRNRLLGAFATKTIVVEAGEKAGALATAEEARVLGRAVGAVPGPLKSASSAGCIELIQRHGAVPVNSLEAALALGS
jgi:DNA processing protein